MWLSMLILIAKEKLLFLDRYNDIQTLAVPLCIDGHGDFHLKMRFFKSDNPEQQFELGVSQGGHWKCSACGVQTRLYCNLRRCMEIKRLSVNDRKEIATAGVYGKQPSRANAMQGLKKPQLVQELSARDLDTTGLATELRERLDMELRGTRRVLTLLYR